MFDARLVGRCPGLKYIGLTGWMSMRLLVEVVVGSTKIIMPLLC